MIESSSHEFGTPVPYCAELSLSICTATTVRTFVSLLLLASSILSLFLELFSTLVSLRSRAFATGVSCVLELRSNMSLINLSSRVRIIYPLGKHNPSELKATLQSLHRYPPQICFFVSLQKQLFQKNILKNYILICKELT